MKWLRGTLLPVAIGIVICICLIFCKTGDVKIIKIDFILNAVVTCVVTMAGFVLTSLSIIVSMGDSAIMKHIHKNNGTHELILRYSVTLILSLAMICLFITTGANMTVQDVVPKIWFISCCSLSGAYVVSLVTTIYYLTRIISRVSVKNVVESSDDPSVPKGDFR